MKFIKYILLGLLGLSCYKGSDVSNENCETVNAAIYQLETLDPFTSEVQALQNFLTVFVTDSALARRYAFLISKNSSFTGIPAGIIAGMILRESGGNSSAIGPRIKLNNGDYDNAIGLMQIVPGYWKGAFPECGENLFDPETNICYGSRILKIFLEAEEWNYKSALSRYSGRARRYESYVYEFMGEYYIHQMESLQ